MRTPLGLLQTANHNLINSRDGGESGIMLRLPRSQLREAVILLEKGYDLHVDTWALFEEFGSIEGIPDRKYISSKDLANPKLSIYKITENRDE